MRAFVGQTRSRSLIARLATIGIGEITQPREVPPRRCPWVLDNGAFSAWRSGRPFDDAAWSCALTSAAAVATAPAFAVCPDIVATGRASLAFSVRSLPHCASSLPGLPWYLSVQDGMTEAEVSAAVREHGFGGIFVGGSLPWKIATGAAWVALAHRLGLPSHIGRVGGPDRIRWARRIGADSIDSSLPLWSEENLCRFLRALDPNPPQGSLW